MFVFQSGLPDRERGLGRYHHAGVVDHNHTRVEGLHCQQSLS